MFSTMLMDAYRDERTGIHIAYRTSGHLANSRRIQASARLFTTTVPGLLFAVDCALNNISENDVEWSMELFTAGCVNFGLTINTDETAVMHKLPPNAAYGVHRIHVNGTQQKTVHNFAYLGGTPSCCIKIDDEVAYRTSKAR
ncbi:hypothetical protein SprV_0401658100 [Sparganum proliferum]